MIPVKIATKEMIEEDDGLVSAMWTSVGDAGHKAHYNLKKKRQLIRKTSPVHQIKRVVKKHSKKTWLYKTLHPESSRFSSRLFRVFITVVILMSVISFIMSTDEVQSTHMILTFIEWFTTAVFTIEYLLRLFTCTESKSCNSRWKFILSCEAMIDLISVLPFYAELCIYAVSDIHTTYSTKWISAVRIFRLFRILKSESFMAVFKSLFRVIWYNRTMLFMALVLDMFFVLISASCLYYSRNRDLPPDEQAFNSIPGAFYISLLMLTGQGLPDGKGRSFEGLVAQFILGTTACFAIVVFAIPAGMLTCGFQAESERLLVEKREKRERRRRRIYLENEDLENEDDIASTSDEEIRKDGLRTLASVESKENIDDELSDLDRHDREKRASKTIDYEGNVAFKFTFKDHLENLRTINSLRTDIRELTMQVQHLITLQR